MVDTQRTRTGRIRLGRNSGRFDRPDAAGAPGPHGAGAVIEAPFPESRLLRWTPEAQLGETPADNDVALVVTQEVFLEVNHHVSRTLERELGGFLLGNLYRCPNTGRSYLVVDQSTRAQFSESSDVHLAFTLDTWAHLGEELGGKFLGKLVVGWYHSHPRMDVFLSSYDVAIHEERFAEPWMTALVVEPEKNRGGFFRWQAGKLNPRTPVEFYELVARRAEDSVVDWTNHVLAGGHRPEPPAGRRQRTFLTGGLSRSREARGTGELEEPGVTAPRHSPLLLVLAGVLLGVVLCGGAWLLADRLVAAGTTGPAPLPADVSR